MSDERAALYAAVMSGGYHSPDRSERASKVIDAYRAAVLREAADMAGEWRHSSPQMASLERKLRRMADEARKGTHVSVPTEEEQRDPNWCWMHNKVCTPQDHREEEQDQ